MGIVLICVCICSALFSLFAVSFSAWVLVKFLAAEKSTHSYHYVRNPAEEAEEALESFEAHEKAQKELYADIEEDGEIK